MLYNEKTNLKSHNPTTSRIYRLPKIYKPGKKMCPIINSINTPTYNLARLFLKCDIMRKNLERHETNKNGRGDRVALT